MRLEDQVVSPELAKELKRVGVNTVSHHSWVKVDLKTDFYRLEKSRCSEEADRHDYYAYTVAELGEMLPSNLNNTLDAEIMDKGLWLSCDKSDDGEWVVGYGEDGTNHFEILDETTEANARAKMLIYLIENKLIDANVESSPSQPD